MARKPNYQFEWMERDRAKAAKAVASQHGRDDVTNAELLDAASLKAND
jgi:hypothetical protein